MSPCKVPHAGRRERCVFKVVSHAPREGETIQVPREVTVLWPVAQTFCGHGVPRVRHQSSAHRKFRWIVSCHSTGQGLTLEQRSSGGSETVERADITQHPCMVPAAPRGLRLAAERSHRDTCTRFPGCMTTLRRLGAWPADTHCLTALDAGSLKSRCQKMQFPWKGFLSGHADDCLLSVSSPVGKREISELSAVSSYKNTIL